MWGRRMSDDPREVMAYGDALLLIPGFDAGTFDAIITDPPYSSGGAMRSDKGQPTASKYSTAKVPLPDFAGDTRPQLAYQYWTTLWTADALRVTKAGGWLMTFTDWRQLAPTIVAVEAAGWVFRGIVVWNKTSGRPVPNRFTAACEYVVTATKGAHPLLYDDATYTEGVVVASAPSDRAHITQKPVTVMRHLMKPLRPDSLILDPFAGTGTTLEAARDMGHRCMGIDISDEWAGYAERRVAQRPLDLGQTDRPKGGDHV